MRAVLCDRYGRPICYAWRTPASGAEDDEVLIRIHATTVNRTVRAVRASRRWPACTPASFVHGGGERRSENPPMCLRRADLRDGRTILVYGASGCSGSDLRARCKVREVADLVAGLGSHRCEQSARPRLLRDKGVPRGGEVISTVIDVLDHLA